MRRRSLLVALFSFVAILAAISILHVLSVFARRPIRTLASSSNGGSPPSFCADNATPFAAALTGKVSTDGTCIDFTSSTYPDGSQILSAADKSFSLTVTPVLWENGASSTSTRQTIIHLAFSATNTNLKLTSFVIGGLLITPVSPQAPAPPAYVACALNMQVTPPGPLYTLTIPFDNSTNPVLPQTPVCVDSTLTFADASGNVGVLKPIPVQFADGNTTRWDIDGVSGSSTVNSVDLLVEGFPSSLTNVDITPGNSSTPTPSNNLDPSFMKDPNNFLAVAIDAKTGTVETAGGLSLASITALPTNDSIGTPTVVDPNVAIASGFADKVNASTAQPQQDSAGNLTNAPTNPADPLLPANCFNGGGPSAPLLRTVWYSFTPIGDGSITIDTAGSRYDTVVAVFTGTSGNLTLVNSGCADDFLDTSQAVHLQAKLSNLQVTHGTQYFVLVGESPTETGNLIGADGNQVSPAVTVAAPLSNDATLFFSLTETPTPPGISLAPANNAALNFGSLQVGTTSAAQTVTVTSKGGTPLSISNISVPSGFKASGCSSPVLQGSSCQVSVTFQPTSTGALSGNLTFTNNVPGSSPSYPVTGTGTDFTFPPPSQSASTGTLTSTAAATFSLSASGSSGFTSSITFTCQNLPTNTQCAFSPNPASPGSGNTIPVTLTVSRISTAGALPIGWKLNLPFEELLWALLLFVLFLLRSRIARLAPRRFAYGIVLFALLWMAGCGGGSTQMTPPPPPPATGSYPFTATATVSGAPAKTINLTLTVQ